MKSSAGHIYFIISRVILLGVYSVFFLVQSINAYLNLNNATPSIDNCISVTSSLKKIVLVSTKSKDTHKSNIRLNKRFHPEGVISLGYAPVEPLIQIIANNIVSKPQDYLLISSILTDSLRGPPAVV